MHSIDHKGKGTEAQKIKECFIKSGLGFRHKGNEADQDRQSDNEIARLRQTAREDLEDGERCVQEYRYIAKRYGPR